MKRGGWWLTAAIIMLLLSFAAICFEAGMLVLTALVAVPAAIRGRSVIRFTGIAVAAVALMAAVPQLRKMPRGRIATIPDSLLVVNGVQAYSLESEARRVLGASDSTEGYWSVGDLDVSTRGSHVVGLYCRGTACTLPSGIALGTTQAEVEGRLGPTVSRPGTLWYAGSRGCLLTLSFDEGRRLAAIRLSCDSLTSATSRPSAC
jgi:hypothetical protein